MKRIGVIFDKDGTLFDTEWMYEKAWIEVGKNAGVPLDEAFAKKARGLSDPLVYELIESMYPGADAIRLRQESLELADRYMEEELTLKPGAKELLAYLKEQGYRMAIASAAPLFRIQNHIQRTGIQDYFDALVAGNQVAKGKPYPDIFEEAAKRLGLSCRQCYVVEDAANGIIAGHKAGCFTVMIPDLEQPTSDLDGMLDRCCDSLYEMMECLKKGEWE